MKWKEDFGRYFIYTLQGSSFLRDLEWRRYLKGLGIMTYDPTSQEIGGGGGR